MCKEDILFYCRLAVWTYDPRKVAAGQDPEIPFIPYPYQEETLLGIQEALGNEDILIQKSRDMGASWMVVLTFEHAWHFRNMMSFLMISRKESLVDSTENPDSLFWKLRYINRMLPSFLKAPCNDIKLHRYNEETGSTIDGESTTAEAGTGGRRTAIMIDEYAKFPEGDAKKVLASTRDNSRCRIFNSTPQGEGNAFHEMKEKMIRERQRVFTLHWSLHPEKAKGIWIDPDKEGIYKYRSTWYDEECKRAAHPKEIAQELDIDYLGSSFTYFDQEFANKLIREGAQDPIFTGEFVYDPVSLDNISLRQTPHGYLSMWVSPSLDFGPDFFFAIGADIAMGSRDSKGRGATESILSIADRRTGLKVAEIAVHGMVPEDFAELAVVACRYFRGRGSPDDGAYLIFEANGPGQQFRDKIVKIGYGNVYYRMDHKYNPPRRSDQPGWWTTRETRKDLLGAYRIALRDGKFLNPSEKAIKETLQYIWTPNGNEIVHVKATTTWDPSGARENHADRVIADALASWAIKETRPPDPEKEEQEVPPNCMMWRRLEAEKARKQKQWW